jgi:hypothetical protein
MGIISVILNTAAFHAFLNTENLNQTTCNQPHPPSNDGENQRKLSRKMKKKKLFPDFSFSETKSVIIQLLHDK